MHACFFAPVRDRRLLESIEFYRQDLDILRGMGLEVTVATRWAEIPWRADLYFVWWWTWAFLPLLKARLGRRPLLVTGTFYQRRDAKGDDYSDRPPWQRVLLRLALHRASANVFVSQLERDTVPRQLGARNPHYIPHTVDCDLYVEGDAERHDLVFTVAWLERQSVRRKCVAEILRAIPLVRAQYPGVRFVVAGEHGSAYPEILSLARDLRIEDVVEFPGAVSRQRKIDLMRTCRVYLQPSLYEGFGLAVLEAMSCGAAVVSSPVGAVPEVVGDAGLLVDGSSPESIAAAVNRLLGDEALRRELGRKGRRRAESEFPLDRRRRELGQLIESFLHHDA